MKNNIEELMEKELLSENKELSQMISDIVPVIEKRFTTLEIEAINKQEFSLVIYKKENTILSFFNSIKLILEKIKIIRHSKKFKLQNINYKN